MTENKGDLISREALKEALSKRLWFVSSPECDAQEIKDIIDNAPTVEQKYYERVIAQINPVIEARPQGEWLKNANEIYQCSLCGGYGNPNFFNYCPYCGADMRPKPNQLRDCENCIHHSENGCEVWECEFEKRSDV